MPIGMPLISRSVSLPVRFRIVGAKPSQDTSTPLAGRAQIVWEFERPLLSFRPMDSSVSLSRRHSPSLIRLTRHCFKGIVGVGRRRRYDNLGGHFASNQPVQYRRGKVSPSCHRSP